MPSNRAIQIQEQGDTRKITEMALPCIAQLGLPTRKQYVVTCTYHSQSQTKFNISMATFIERARNPDHCSRWHLRRLTDLQETLSSYILSKYNSTTRKIPRGGHRRYQCICRSQIAWFPNTTGSAAIS